jgi:hypothetical protein
MANNVTARSQLIDEIQTRLGGGMIDLELEDKEYNLAITFALDRYRQRSGNSVEESFVFFDAQPDVNKYTLPKEIQNIVALYRRNIGGTAGGASIDPFSLAFTNNIYMISNPGGMDTGGAGMLATYDFAMQYQELVGRMFGRDILYTWDTYSKSLTIQRKITYVEQIMVHVYNARPEEVIINDVYARPWIRDYALAQCKLMIAEARGKFQSLAGPQGGITMNADALKSEAQSELERLEQEIIQLIDSDMGYGFVIG